MQKVKQAINKMVGAVIANPVPNNMKATVNKIIGRSFLFIIMPYTLVF